MKILIRLGLTILTIATLSACTDDFIQRQYTADEGNLQIRLASNTLKTKSTRAEGDESDNIVTSEGNPDEYYVNPEDFRFYLFDNTDKCVYTLSKDDLLGNAVKRTDENNNTYTEFNFNIPERLTGMKVLALTNVESFNATSTYGNQNTYPDFSNKSLEDVYDDVANLFTYPVLTGDITWQPSEADKSGIPMFGISEPYDVQYTKINIEVPVIRALAKIEVEYTQDKEKLEQETSSCTIYVLNNSGWSQVYIYSWYINEDGILSESCGGWPGKSPDGSTIIDGEEYFYYNIPATGQTQNIIFNNNNGIQIEGPQELVLRAPAYHEEDGRVIFDYYAEYYYELKRGTSLSDVEYLNLRQSHNGRTIYLKSNISWDPVYLYLYQQVDGTFANDIRLNGAWPGKQPTGRELIGDDVYYFWDLGTITAGSDHPVLIFNNKVIQTQDLDVTLDKDLYFEINDDTPNDLQLIPDGHNIYMKNSSGWLNKDGDSGLYLYMYGDANGITGDWPGMKPSGTTEINGEDYYSYHINQNCEGGKQFLIFNDGNESQLPEYEWTATNDLHLEIKGYWEPQVSSDSDREDFVDDESTHYKVYVEDKSGWENLALYMWGAKELMGGWPGKTPDGETVVDGITYKYFVLPFGSEGLNENLIFNNNGEGQQTLDYNHTFNGNLYLKLGDQLGISQIDKTSNNNKIYLRDNSGWDTTYLYMWGDINDLGGGWPGMSSSGSEEIDGITYKYYELQQEWIGKNEHFIFNNNNGQQIDDGEAYNIGGTDYYFSLGQVSEIKTEPFKEPAYYTIYIENGTDWENLYLYSYGDVELFNAWPGRKGEKIDKDGKKYFTFNVPYKVGDVYTESLTEYLIFNNGLSGDDQRQLSQYSWVVSGDLYAKVPLIEEVSNPEHDTFTIGIINDIGWDDIYIYSYENSLLGDEPGIKYSRTQTINGVEYYMFDLDEKTYTDVKASDLKNKSGYLKFNDGKEAEVVYYTDQERRSENPEKFTFNKDLYLSIRPLHIDAPDTISVTNNVEVEDRYIRSVTLSFYNDKGSLIPDLSDNKNQDWNQIGAGVTTPTIPGDVENKVNLKFKYDDNYTHSWVAYIPEMTLGNLRPEVGVDFKAFPTTIPFVIDNYKSHETDEDGNITEEGGAYSEKDPDKALQGILRNHIYHFKVAFDLDHIDIKYTTCPWILIDDPVIIKFN